MDQVIDAVQAELDGQSLQKVGAPGLLLLFEAVDFRTQGGQGFVLILELTPQN